MTTILETKNKQLVEIIGSMGRVAVACSGGVDSTYLLKNSL
jgi:PP-loop superfamily ATP-utilizing enzyme